MLSVQTTNMIGDLAVEAAIGASAGAFGALLMGSPIGAAGGALFGGVYKLVLPFFIVIGSSLLNANHPDANTASKVMAAVMNMLGCSAAGWAALTLEGFVLTAKEVCVLTVFFGISLVVSFLGQFCFQALKAQTT